jgi:methionyl-tRNA synthetase
MGILSKLFGETTVSTENIETPPCPHASMTARWDSVEDIGHDERATAYICESCGESFSPEEAAELRRSEVERLPIDV